jgi:hypothetical protein
MALAPELEGFMKKYVVAAVLASTALMSAGAGVASADEVEVDGTYSSLAGCQADGPHVEITHNDHLYTHFDCRQGSDGLWHVFLSN